VIPFTAISEMIIDDIYCNNWHFKWQLFNDNIIDYNKWHFNRFLNPCLFEVNKWHFNGFHIIPSCSLFNSVL
jgi:hypothetical protein